jgi:hypothetical protein
LGALLFLIKIDLSKNNYFFHLFAFLQAAAADALSKFYYPPVAAVSISYPKEAIRTECLINGELKGFGQLHPRSQGVETLGIFALIYTLVMAVTHI